jgi:hypothetical protein
MGGRRQEDRRSGDEKTCERERNLALIHNAFP